VDVELWRQLEPGTANPFKRLGAMRRLREAGVTAGVMMAPILPGITDSEASIAAVAAAAREYGAAHLGTAPLRLAPHVKEFYLGFIGLEYPQLLGRYQRAYPGTYAPPEYRDKLDERVERIRERYGFARRSERRQRTTLPRRGPQLLLPL
jgi:DNA repair photolyase